MPTKARIFLCFGIPTQAYIFSFVVAIVADSIIFLDNFIHSFICSFGFLAVIEQLHEYKPFWSGSSSLAALKAYIGISLAFDVRHFYVSLSLSRFRRNSNCMSLDAFHLPFTTRTNNNISDVYSMAFQALKLWMTKEPNDKQNSNGEDRTERMKKTAAPNEYKSIQVEKSSIRHTNKLYHNIWESYSAHTCTFPAFPHQTGLHVKANDWNSTWIWALM